jgi:hypothetical protein
MIDKIFEGTIDHWVDQGSVGPRSYGFITFDNGARTATRVYFCRAGITEDNIGRTLHGRILGNLVRFRIEKTMHRGETPPRAYYITSVFPVDADSPEDHREISFVEKLTPTYAFLRRKCGDQIYLNRLDVVEAFRDRWPTLQEGSRIWHGVSAPNEGQTWRAVAAEIFAPDEQ